MKGKLQVTLERSYNSYGGTAMFRHFLCPENWIGVRSQKRKTPISRRFV
jgi:hypothetical protein